MSERPKPRFGLIINASGTLLAAVTSELLVNYFAGTEIGKKLEVPVSIVAYVLIVASGLVLLWGLWRYRKYNRSEDHGEPEPRPSLDFAPAEELIGRDTEIGNALDRAQRHGLVAVLGPRDIGTSAVAAVVAERLPVDPEPLGGKPSCYRLDLRSRSSDRPDTPLVVAARLLTAFGEDEPARGDPETLAAAADRLFGKLVDRRSVLFLDEVSLPEQIDWLITRLPRDRGVTVILAGDQAVEACLPDDRVISLRPLDYQCSRELLELALGGRRSRWFLGGKRDAAVRRLAEDCHGHPRALLDVGQELSHGHTDWTPEGLADALERMGRAGEPVLRVRIALLEKIRTGMADTTVELMNALAGLKVTELSAEALAAMVPDPAQPGRPRDELISRNLLRPTGKGRFRMPQEVRVATNSGQFAQDCVRAAQRATVHLLRYYADLAEEWASVLGTPDAARAVRWFKGDRRLLRLLVTEPSDPEVLNPGFDDLRRIADALDLWYVREHMPDDLAAVAEGLCNAAVRVDRQDVVALALVRRSVAYRMLGHGGDAEQVLAELDRPTSAVAVRQHNARALLWLQQAENPAPESSALIDNADQALRRGLELVPERDVAGQVAIRINLGVLELRRGRPDEAAMCFTRAARTARAGGDLSGEAQAVELQGIAAWRDGDQRGAIQRWRRALEKYETVAEEQGVARCQLHLGSAAVTCPDLAGVVRGGLDTGLTEREATAEGVRRLLESIALRAGQPRRDRGLVLAEHYLRLARAREPDHPV